MEVNGKNLKKWKTCTGIAIQNKAKILNDESMILKIVYYNFREGPGFMARGSLSPWMLKKLPT